MGKLRKTAYLATVAITAMLYGKARFESSRYEPQCETLPGVCIYADERPTKIRIETNSRRGTSENWFFDKTLVLSYPWGDKKIEARYKNYEIHHPYMLIFGKEQYQHCFVKEPVQIVIDSKNRHLAKGCAWAGSSFDYRTYLEPYTGFKEMFWRPKPIEKDCILEKTNDGSVCTEPYSPGCVQSRNDPGCLPSYSAVIVADACKTEKALQRLMGKSSSYWACELENARLVLVEKGLSAEKRSKHIIMANALIDKLKDSPEIPEMPKHTLWKWWNLTIAVIFSPLAFKLISSVIKLGKKTGDKMDEKKKKWKELAIEYEKKMVELFAKVRNAKSVEECREIQDEWAEFRAKMIAQDKAFYASNREENLRFGDAISGKIGLLGGKTMDKWR